MDETRNYWTDGRATEGSGRRLGRRAFLRIAAGGALAAPSLWSACSSSKKPAATVPARPAASSSTLPAAAVPGGPRRGGTLLVAVADDPSSLDPATGGSGGDHQFLWTLYNNLVTYDQKGVPDPRQSLAESWDIASDSMTITFHLRTGVKFHDGTPFDAEAVKWNLDRTLDPKTAATAAAELGDISRTDVLDAATVRVSLKRPNAALLTLLGDRGGFMLSPSAAQHYGDQIGHHPVGTGPFRFVEWQQKDHVTVERNPDYWEKDATGSPSPYLDGITWKVIPDASTAEANLQTGAVHLAGLRAADVAGLQHNAQISLVRFVGAGWVGWPLNLAIPPMDDINVRRAVAWGLDRAAIKQALYFGETPVAKGPLPPPSWAYNPDLPAPDFDLRKAQDYLAKSSKPRGFRLPILTDPAQDAIQRAELEKDQLAMVGIELDIQAVETAARVDKMYRQRTSPAVIGGFSARVDPDGMISMAWRSDSFYNPGHVKNDQLDGLIDQARATFDMKTRQKLYDQIQQIVAGDVLSVFEVYSVVDAGFNRKVQNTATAFGPEGKLRYKGLWIQT